MFGRPPSLIYGTAPLDAGFCDSCRNNTDHELGGSSLAPWLVGLRRTRIRHWQSDDQDTTQDMASKTLAAVRWALPNLPRPVSRCFPSAIACLQGWKRLEPGSSRSPAPRVLVLLVARWLAEQHQQLLGLYFCLLFETYMRPSERLALARLPSVRRERGSSERSRVSRLWSPLRYRLVQRWSFSHVDFCGWRWSFSKTHWYVVHSLWHTIMSFSRKSFYSQSLHLQWTSHTQHSKILDK